MSKRQLAIPIPEKLYLRVQKLLPWGQRATIIAKLIEQLCDLLDSADGEVLVKIYSGRIRLVETTDGNVSPEEAERAIGDYLRRKGPSDDDEE